MASQRFRDREAAGRLLGPLVADSLGGPVHGSAAIVLGLPRGGVAVAAPVADQLGAELDVLCVRKIGAPGHRELAIGAVASGGLTVFNHDLIDRLGVRTGALEARAASATEELREQEQRLRPDRPALTLTDRVVVVVDDGLATGATMQAALRVVRTAGPEHLIAAVPVGAPDSCALVTALADVLVCPLRPANFSAVGQFYDDFSATEDVDVLRLLAARPRPA